MRNAAASVEGDAISPSFEGPVHFVEAGGTSPHGAHKKRRGVLISSARLLLEILTIYEVFSEFLTSVVLDNQPYGLSRRYADVRGTARITTAW